MVTYAITIIQGGVHRSVVAKLKEQLDACGYKASDPKFYVVLFCDCHGFYDGAPFGLVKSDKESDFEDTNIHPVELNDPTQLKPWDCTQLGAFYKAVGRAHDAVREGKTLVAVCMKGANRSKAVQYALDPKEENLSTCVSMQRAAKGYLANRDLKIVPLGPTRASRSRATEGEKETKKQRQA